nr:putative ulp1 protease family, C-terminal catalytic domain-containing protein [Ipomoea batatas]
MDNPIMFQLFFPILENEHYYLLCADFETGRLEIIDNSASTESTANKYGDTIDNATKRMQMKWRDHRNKIDCRVYLMRHMESYCGEGVNRWVCGLKKGDRSELNSLRLHYIKEIFTSDVNTHRTSNVARALAFHARSSAGT